MRYWFGNCADPFKRWEQRGFLSGGFYPGVSIRGFLSGGFYPGVSIRGFLSGGFYPGVSIRGFLSGGFYPGVSIIESIDQVKALIKPPTQR